MDLLTVQQNSVVILLSSYNGENYIKEQILSIQRQSFQDWLLLIRDDCSTDNTLSIIKQCALADDRISIQSSSENIGVVRSFELLMKLSLQNVSINYIFFSDQDNVWHPDKLVLILENFKEIELTHNKADSPILIHSDLEVVNSDLKTISSSFMSYQGIRHESIAPWRVLAVQNFVTGCSMAINRNLLCQSLPFPECSIMHDWWIALIASISGNINFIDKPLVKYRQHEDNKVGAKSFWSLINPFTQNVLVRWKTGAKHFNLALNQVDKALNRTANIKKDVNYLAINDLRDALQILKQPRIKRLLLIPRLKVKRQNKITSFLLFIRIFLS